MKLSFTKMNGAGNDFILLDNRSQALHLTKAQIAHLCDRHRGVGADGLLLVESVENGRADCRMRYYNSDGGEAEMCGNGARCFARFAQKIGVCRDRIRFETLAGAIQAELEGPTVRVHLSDPQGLRLREKVHLSKGMQEISSLNTGVPHAVLMVEDADQAMVGSLGSEVRRHSRFAPKGTNVNFVQRLEGDAIRVRTYERGVEGETLACGTGVVASSLIAHALFGLSSPISAKVQGGDAMEVCFREKDGEFHEVSLKGPADFTFEGTTEI